MQTLRHVIFWVLIAGLLVVTFGQGDHDYIKTLYYVTFLMPVAIGTSYFFNYFLVPRYLLTRRYIKFGLYLFYTLIFSLYFEQLVLTLSFIALANYKYTDLNPYSTNLLLLTMTIYLIVMVNAFFMLIRRYQNKEHLLTTLETEKEKQKIKTITVKVDRKNVPINLDDILIVESLADYVKIHTNTDQIITREKISELDQRLPESFIRTHRSFLVNQKQITSFGKESVNIGEVTVPISRTYKKTVSELLEANQSLI